MTSYRYLGYGVTNSNGVAHLDHDPQGNPINGYTGTGAGEIDVVASLDNPVESGSIVSGTYQLLDTLLYDKGLSGTGNYNDSAWDNISYFTEFSRGENGTTVTNNKGANRYLPANIVSGTTYDFNTPFRLEFNFEKLNQTSTNSQLQVMNEQNENFSTWLGANGHYVIDVKENEVTWTIDGRAQTGKTVTLGTVFVRFYLPNGASMKFSNFKIYPI